MNLERKINIIGDIDEAAYANFVETLDGYEEILSGDSITIELTSAGGDAMVALAFFDRIRNIPGNVTIYAYGHVASAAVIILAAGDRRVMAKNAWVMVHQETVVLPEDTRVGVAERAVATARHIENQWSKLLASVTKLPARDWDHYHLNETYMDAKECLRVGLVDEII